MYLKSLFAATFVAIVAASPANAQEGVKCKFLSTVDACVKCSLLKKSSSKFSTGGINDWCAAQVAQNAGQRKK